MAFSWLGCVDGSSINVNKIDAFTVGQVQKHDSSGQPLWEDEEKKVPVPQMIVFAVIGAINFPLRPVNHMGEAQQVIQGILGKMKADYDKEHNSVVVASSEERQALKLS